MAYCCVPFCKSKFKKKSDISFHEFPCDEFQRFAWLRAICRKDYKPNDTSNYSRVCGLHFKKDDFRPNLKYRKLKSTAVPTIFPGYPSWHRVKVAPFPKVNHKKSVTFQNRVLLSKNESNSSMLTECNSVNANVDSVKFNEPNPEIGNFRNQQSQTKVAMSPKKIYKNRKLKKLLHSKNKQILRLKQKMAMTTLNGNPECYVKESFSASVEEMQVLESNGSPEKSRNEPQKIVFISSGSNNVCIDETDMETILKAMNGEDISNKNDELSAAALRICEPVIEHSDTDHAETGNNESRSNDSTSERHLQISNVQGNASQDHQASNRCFTSILTPKKKDDVKLPQPRTEEKNFPTTSKVPEQTVEFKTCNCKKDEIDLYAALLATKLRTLDQKSRHVAMNKIDNMIFKIKMEHYEGQQRPQNVAAHQKSLPANPNAKE